MKEKDEKNPKVFGNQAIYFYNDSQSKKIPKQIIQKTLQTK